MPRGALNYASQTCRSCKLRVHATNRSTKRFVQIAATPSTSQPQQGLEPSPSTSSTPSADARFEVLGTPFSLLSASISASQELYTRKGTLVGFSGRAENTVSTLSLLGPFKRAALGIPFIYQKISSTTPYTALIGTKSPVTSLVVVHLDGRIDWMIARRNALLAWTGHTLKLLPRWNTKMSLAHWGNTAVTGRGLIALSGKGLIHQITLKAGEEYVVHPSNVIAYNMMQNAPKPYRFKSSSLRLQIPNPLSWLPNTRFWRTVQESTFGRILRDTSFMIRTWTRRTIWGDRLFLHFHGPATVLLQSRAAAISEVLTTRDVNEIADSPAGTVPSVMATRSSAESGISTQLPPPTASPTTMSYANIGQDGNVKFNKS